MSTIRSAQRPVALDVRPDGIPAELKALTRWVIWSFQWEDKGWTKPPFRVDGGGRASSTVSATWSTFDAAIAAYQSRQPLCDGTAADGIGFAIEGSGLFGVDLDDCRDPLSGETKRDASDIMQDLNCWTEVSPSGCGFRMIGRGALPCGRRRRGWIEAYTTGRYFTVTGHILPGTPSLILDRQDAISAFHAKHLADCAVSKPAVKSLPSPGVILDDAALIERAMGAQNGGKFSALWSGDTTGYSSPSEADLAFCNLLAFWTGKDEVRMDCLFRQSGLFREKWNREDYRKSTINRAIEQTQEVYSPGANGGQCATRSKTVDPPGNSDSEKRTIEKKQRGPSQSTLLVREVEGTKGIEFFHSPDGDPFASFVVNGCRQTWPIRSKGLRSWLSRLFYSTRRKVPGSQALEDALRIFEARAMFDGVEREVFCRTAFDGHSYFLDLGDASWRAIRVTSAGWSIESDLPVRFRRSSGMEALPEPLKGGSLSELRPFVNVPGENDWRLVLAYLVAALRPKGPYVVAVLQGEQGSAKSSTARVLRALLDPSSAPLRAVPREERDLMIAARNGWVLNFDNLSGIPTWLSDALCRLATGGGLATRALYSDFDEVLFDAQRPIIVNGIDDLASRDDLRDRSIIVTLPNIRAEDRRDEHEFWTDFETARPRILGALLDALSGALRELPHVDALGLPRMADFAVLGIALERALGWPTGAFMSAYTGNREDATAAGLDAEPVAQALIEMVGEGLVQGTASSLLRQVAEHLSDDHVIKRSPAWPKGPRAMANRIRRIAPMLRTSGVEVRFGERDPGRNRDRIITLERTGNPASVPSVASELPAEART